MKIASVKMNLLEHRLGDDVVGARTCSCRSTISQPNFPPNDECYDGI